MSRLSAVLSANEPFQTIERQCRSLALEELFEGLRIHRGVVAIFRAKTQLTPG